MSTASIDTGVCLGNVPTDFDGVALPQGPGCDRGAYEYLAAGSLPGIPANIFPVNGATNVALFPPPLTFTSTNATAYDFSFSSFSGQSDPLFIDLWNVPNSSDLGAFWTPYLIGKTSAQIVTQHVRNTSTTVESVERFDGGALATDQWGRLRLTTFGTGYVWAGLLLRCQNVPQVAGYWVGAVKGWSTFRTMAWRYDSTGSTYLASEDTTPWTSGDLLEVHIVGNTLTVFRNGNTDLRLTATDPAATYATGGICLSVASDSFGQLEVDNFEAGDIGPVFQGTFATGSFPLTGLMPAQTYYWKPAGRNSTGVTEGAINTFTTETSSVPVTPIGVRLRFKSP
jgi:hypothetical protein